MLEAVGFQHWGSLSNQAGEVACVGFLCGRRLGEVDEMITLPCASPRGAMGKFFKKKLLKSVPPAQHTFGLVA